jgi:hypothetical protein
LNRDDREAAIRSLMHKPARLLRLLGVHIGDQRGLCRYCRVAFPCTPALLAHEARLRLRPQFERFTLTLPRPKGRRFLARTAPDQLPEGSQSSVLRRQH